MDVRAKYRMVVPVIAFIAILLIWSQRSRNSSPDNSSLIRELREVVNEKDKEILQMRERHQIELRNIRKSMVVEPQEMAVKTTLREKTGGTRQLVSRAFNGHKLVHLDLKGAAAKMDFLLKLLPVFKSWGITGLLVEYEDMFPYDGELSVLKSHYAYSVKEIKEFLNEIRSHNLLMIPLIQTFGHMEFVLKHQKFSHLRHVANTSSSIDPNHEGSLPLINSIVDQMMKMHKGYVDYLHIGGDEVWSLFINQCAECPPPSEAYLKHILPVIDKVLTYKVTPILWDDMLRSWSVGDLKKIASRRAEPMVWGYAPHLDNHFPEGMWDRYSQAFPAMWFASAFKGADTPATNFVPIQDRIDNHKSWMKVYSQLSGQRVKINGIAMTAWSRYDHYATLCELLPASLPSLALCLSVLKTGGFSNETVLSVSKQLGFKSRIIFSPREISSDPHNKDEGTFLGHSVYGIVLALRQAYNTLDSVEKRMPSWFNHRQAVTLKISIYQLTVSFRRIEKATAKLTILIKEVKETFSKFYNDDMINEWIWDKIKNKLMRAKEIKEYLEKIKNILTKHKASKPITLVNHDSVQRSG